MILLSLVEIVEHLRINRSCVNDYVNFGSLSATKNRQGDNFVMNRILRSSKISVPRILVVKGVSLNAN